MHCEYCIATGIFQFTCYSELYYGLKIHLNMGISTRYVINKNFKNDLWLKMFRYTSFRLLDPQSSTDKDE